MLKLGKKFLPYSGGSGPSGAQADNNTMYLARQIASDVKHELDYKHAEELWGGDALNVKITHPVTTVIIYVGYDRWGFCVDGDFAEDVDQWGVDDTVAAIKKWYNKK